MFPGKIPGLENKYSPFDRTGQIQGVIGLLYTWKGNEALLPS